MRARVEGGLLDLVLLRARDQLLVVVEFGLLGAALARKDLGDREGDRDDQNQGEKRSAKESTHCPQHPYGA